MKILLGYSFYPYDYNVGEWYETWLEELRKRGINIDGICLTINPPNERLTWQQLDSKWKNGDKELYLFYKNIAEKSKEYEVFINYNGINLHPGFVKQLKPITVYSCFDDPESSEDLSKPVAWAYDMVRVGNIACIDMYEDWGCKNVKYWPISFRFDSYDHSLTEEKIMLTKRVYDISLLCERESPWRKERLDKFVDAFPNGEYYGLGWPKGFLKETQKIDLYQNTKIGINMHNSSGPINFRTFEIPANGAMLICDNKEHLSKIYKLGEEAIGYDTIEEAIALCRYYLQHEEERKKIALNGWKRVMKDYNSVRVFENLIEDVKSNNLNKRLTKKPISLNRQRIQNKIKSIFQRY